MKLKRIRSKAISKEELIADIIFFTVPALLSAIAVFFFDIHHSFYPGRGFYPFTRIFENYDPYIIAMLIGGVFGFFIIKLLMFGFMEEEKIGKKS